MKEFFTGDVIFLVGLNLLIRFNKFFNDSSLWDPLSLLVFVISSGITIWGLEMIISSLINKAKSELIELLKK